MTLPTRPDGRIDWERVRMNGTQIYLVGRSPLKGQWMNLIAFSGLVATHTRERCAMKALEQRCERGIPWDRACVAIAAEIRKMED